MRARVFLNAVLLAAAYVVVARLGLALDAVSGFAAPVWPPTGLAIACLLLGQTALWPGVMIGAFTANLLVGAPLLAAAAIGVGNTLEALVAALVLRRLGFRLALERVRDVALLTGAALLSPLLSAGIGVPSLYLSGIVTSGRAGAAFRAWWIGDALGALVVAPLVLMWAQRQPPPGRHRVPEVLALGGLTALITLFVFAGPHEDFAPFHQPFLVFPVLVWAAIRFGQRMCVTATFLISATAIAATALRLGPFARPQLHESLLALQVFLGVVAIGVMLLGAVVTERSRVQEALREAVAVRDEFLSIAGHELRTPLSALGLELGSLHRRLQENGAASTSARAAPDADSDSTSPASALAHRAQRAIRQVERLNQLINRLLEVSQLRLGHLPLERTEVDLRAPVQDVLERFTEQAEQADCRLELRAEGPVTGYWDPIRLEQVTTNLIANAIKYGPGKPIEVSVERQGSNAVLTVRDHGIGVPEGQVDRIFDRFARAAPTRHFGGLGLGLYIARQIVQAHGGTIQVGRQSGAGSSFVVQLPLGRG